jgi:predicted XRE-type DNA-binding protein
MSDDLTVHDSSGNVFEDMGMADADERLAKAEMARLIRIAIRDRGLTQEQAAEMLGVRQPDVSDLVRGKLARFSRMRLERFLNALDLEIRIQVGPRPAWKEHAGITVEQVSSFQAPA